MHLDRPIIMGILNVTPDSFSDGGQFLEGGSAVSHALQMAEEGADIIDVGGESTRPGSKRVDAEEQKRRVLPIIEEIRKELPADVVISIDTTLSEVAEAALDAGAGMINDISAGRDDPEILALAAERRCSLVLMHMQGTPATMQDNPVYTDVVGEIREFLLERAKASEAMGVSRENIIIDPGIGFGKTTEHNLEIIAGLKSFVETGYSVLLGASRKRFMGSVCGNTAPRELVGATCATTVIGVCAGVRFFRVHDVRANRQAADIASFVINLEADPNRTIFLRILPPIYL